VRLGLVGAHQVVSSRTAELERLQSTIQTETKAIGECPYRIVVFAGETCNGIVPAGSNLEGYHVHFSIYMRWLNLAMDMLTI
jgi:hypothetical protein